MTKLLPQPKVDEVLLHDADPCLCPPITDVNESPSLDGSPTPVAPHIYLLETIKFATKFADTALFPIGEYRTELLSQGFQRVFVCNTITGEPGTYVQLWKRPDTLGMGAVYRALDGAEVCMRFRAKTSRYEREFLHPTPYDVSSAVPIDPVIRERAVAVETPETAVLINRLSVVPGALSRFYCAKKEHFIPAVQQLGWQLIASGLPMTGGDRSVINCWAMPNPTRLLQTMREIGQDTSYLQCVAPCIERERQDLFEPRLGK